MLVDELALHCEGGLTALTGETGAGKSITLDALSYAIGGRSQADKLRHGAERCEIAASFDVSQIEQASAWLEKHDLQDEGENDSECLLRRVFSKSGKSQAYINGQRCTLGQLRELGEMLVDIHSQHEHQSLLKVSSHQRLLDNYAGAKMLAERTRQAFSQWRAISLELDAAQSASEEANAEYQLLQYQLAELNSLNLEADELAELEEKQQRLANIETTLTTASQVSQALRSDDGGVLNQLASLNHLIQQLQQNGGSAGAPFTELSGLLHEAQINLEEAASEADRIQDSGLDPSELSAIEARLSEIYTIARKNRVAPEQLFNHQQELLEQFTALNSGDERVAEIEARLVKARKEYDDFASKLSGKRKRAAPKLEQAINERLQLLDMTHSRLAIDLHENHGHPATHGLEKIEFLISTNPESAPQALSKIASGGELSRISLAIQVVTASTSSTPTLVFDEVDVGIGGTTGDVVGQLLRELGEHSQILCVTHLPQVAGKAHHHWRVEKHSENGKLSSRVEQLNDKKRVRELSRMMGGDIESKQAMAHARQMLCA